MLNALTVDVEDWYHTSGLNIPKSKWNQLPATVYPNTMKLLDLFDEYDVKGTFFILGDVARRYPQLVKEIIHRGHEIGSHSMNHQLVYQQSMEEFKQDFYQSIEILQQLSGQKIQYYRAPSWSISREQLEILPFLQENGIVCDSSLQPFKTPLSGMSGISVEAFKPIINGDKLRLIEFPPTVMKISERLFFPFAGGFYLRLFPYQVISCLLKKLNTKRPGMIYVHPWEIDSSIPRWKTSWFIQIIQYYRLHSTERKLRRLLDTFEFAPIGQVIKNIEIKHNEL